MKIWKKGIALAVSIAAAFTMDACSTSQVTSQVTEVFDDLVEDTAENAVPETPVPKTAITDPKTIDTSLAEPSFDQNLNGSVTIAKGDTCKMEVSASSTDGGTITYQWYKNNVNSNGGGSPINGADASAYTAIGSEVGSVFYYVVASNNHDSGCNMATSDTFEVTTVKDGTWQADEFGKKYVNEDGSYPVETWISIQNETYHFDSAGYATVGWLGAGNAFYYFDEEGRLLKNGSTPDGFETDENGKLIGAGTPELRPTTAQIAEEARAAEAAAAEQAAIEAEMAAQQAAEESSGGEEYYEEEYTEEGGGEEYYEEEYTEEGSGE